MLDQLEIGREPPWAGLSLCLGRNEMGPQSTDKLSHEKYQQSITPCCTGEKSPLSFLSRSGDKWLVEIDGNPLLMATAEMEINQPSTTGWLYWSRNATTQNYQEDESVTCTNHVNSPPCCLTVSLSGAAKEAHGDCEGEYKSTELMSMGRPVSIIF